MARGIAPERAVAPAKQEYPGAYMSAADKSSAMELGFIKNGIDKIGGVTAGEFRKVYGYYRETLKDSGGSNTGAVRRAVAAYRELGDRAFPDRPPTSGEKVPSKSGSRSSTSQDGVVAQPSRRKTREEGREMTSEEAGTRTCTTTVQVNDRQDVIAGKNRTLSEVNASTRGSAGTINTQTIVSARDPQTKKEIGWATSGQVPGNQSSAGFVTRMTRPLDAANATPAIKASNSECQFDNGRYLKATVQIHVGPR